MAIPKQWEPPKGLNRPAPRPVRLATLGKALVILSVVFGVLGAGMALLAQRQIERETKREEALRERGADATVTRTWMGGDSKSRTPMVSNRFTTNGREVKSNSAMHREVWPKTMRRIGWRFATCRRVRRSTVRRKGLPDHCRAGWSGS